MVARSYLRSSTSSLCALEIINVEGMLLSCPRGIIIYVY